LKSLETTAEKAHLNAFRNLSTVSLHKVVQLAGIAVSVAFVPRMFGIENYGRFAFVLSLATFGQILGDFGTLDVMGRFVPAMTSGEASRLYMRTLSFKVMVSVAAGVVTAGAALALGQWMQPEWALLTGLMVTFNIIARTPIELALGLNRVGTWMAEQAWRQWVLVGLLLALLPLFGLGGGLLAVVLMEIIFCALGLWWVRDYWQITEFRPDWIYLRPYLYAGASFFLANLIIVALYRSGPVMVEILTRQSTQTGYFNLALGLFLLVHVTLSQFAQSLIPALSGFRAQGQSEQMRLWVRNFVRYSWPLAWLGTVVTWLMADWGVPFVFGADFAPAAPVVKLVSLAIPPSALLWDGSVVATVTGRGRVKFGASLAALLIFVTAAVWLTPMYGAVGTAVALGLSVGLNVMVLGLFLRPDFAVNWLVLFLTALAGVAGLYAISSLL